MTLKSQFLMPHCCTRNGPLGFNCPSLLAAPPGAHLDLVALHPMIPSFEDIKIHKDHSTI